MRQKLFLHMFSCILATCAFAQQSLPTFEDFRRVDRTRRMTGQLHTEELLRVTSIDSRLILAAARRDPDNVDIQWGAAEVIGTWPAKRELFENALRVSRTNNPIALRYALAIAQNREYDQALHWLRQYQPRDSDNIVPWMAEFWVLRQQNSLSNMPTVNLHELAAPPKPQPRVAPPPPRLEVPKPPTWATDFNDYATGAARARIRILEAAGYTPYSARRLGFMPDTYALNMARDLAQPPFEPQAATLLTRTAVAMQKTHTFLVTELIGETLERAIMMQRPDAASSAEVRVRGTELDERREQLKDLLADVEKNAVEFTTEKEMIEYFNNVLAIGEEGAMKQLTVAVRGKPSVP